MLEYVEIKNGDKKLKIELNKPENSGFVIKSITGLGPANANINITKVANSDISLFNSARIDKRNITLEIMPYTLGREESIETLRQRLYEYFPTKKDITLYFKTENRYVYIDGYVESHEANIFSEEETLNISVVCSDPFFYDVDSDGDKQVFGGTIKEFKFPFSNQSITEKKIVFGHIAPHTEYSFNYPGEYETGFMVTMSFRSGATDPVIYDLKHSKILKILSDVIEEICEAPIRAGDVIYINTIPSKKAITLKKSDGYFYNILDAMDIEVSDWLTIVPGSNGFAIGATTGAQNIETEFRYAVSYGGV